MKTLLTAATIAIAATATILTPAFAKQKHRHHAQQSQVWHSAQAGFVPLGTAVGPVTPNSYALPSPYYGKPGDPYGVYWGDKFVGRDPDPNVRRSLMQEWFETRER